jgi:hypothetical protein
MKKLDLSHETLSNVAYVAVGIYGLFLNPWLGSLIILLGIGSGYSHATKIWWPDWFAMWLVFSCILFIDGYQVFSILTAFILFSFGEATHDDKAMGIKVQFLTLGALFLLGAVRFYYLAGWPAFLYVGVFAFALSVRNKRPHGHTTWHYITAAGFLILFL